MILNKVQTLSTETIKPSSPTPQHLHYLPLSSLDQLSPQIYIHVLLFYSNISPSKLKSSLSKTLQFFYPLAGKLTVSPSTTTLQVDCNDQGIQFIQSQTDTNLDAVLLNPPIHQFPDLLPIKSTNFRWDEDPLLAIQLTTFTSGGGFSLGISISHMVSDGASLALFLNSWAGLARSNASEISPRFDTALVFPPQRQLSNRPVPEESPDSIRNVSIKRFVVPSDGVEKLRSKDSSKYRPTRVEAVSALVWSCLNRVRRKDHNMATQVNLRKKMASTEVSEFSFGNVYISVVAEGESTGRSVREAVGRVDEEYVRRRESEGWGGEDARISVGWIFSSWCRMGLYGCDFGCGEPMWVGCGIKDMKDVCILMDAKDGVGVEVWLWLEEEEMGKVERDVEFVEFVSSRFG